MLDKTLNLDNKNRERYERFFTIYKNQGVFKFDQEKKTFIESKYFKKCRFCCKEFPYVTFRKKAHVIPEFLGNKNLLSKFECDACNAHFSTYETSLASFIGIIRVIAKLGERMGKSAPKHKDPQTGFEIFDKNGEIQFVAHDTDDEFTIDKRNKTVKIQAKKQSYIPLHVYKCLVKIGLSLINDQEFKNYKKAVDFIRFDKYNKSFKTFPLAMLFIHSFPGPFNTRPLVFIYKKLPENKNSTCPTHCVIICLSNHMYQFFLPFNDADFWFYKNSTKIDLPEYPLLLDNLELKQQGEYGFYYKYLYSTEKMVREKEELTLSFDKMIRVK